MAELVDDSSLTVEIAQGKLLGREGQAISGRKFVEFLNIPYGKIPKRFQPAVPAEGWEGVRDATKFGPKAAQFRAPDYLAGVEDCLILNVHTPNLPLGSENKAQFPVIVFLHGGAFQFGGFWDRFGPEYLMEENIVYVAVNFRLGAFGFLSTGCSLASGNNGLKDQVLSLKWVQNNIHAFGGNKDKITLVGESAGGASVFYHILSPMSKGLFHNAISISGSGLCPWAISRNPAQTFEKLANLLNCTGSTTEETLENLQKLDFKEILYKQALHEWNLDPIAAFGPVVENWPQDDNKNESFITESPFKLLAEGKIINKVPWILGNVKSEGLELHASGILRNPELTQEIDKDWLRVFPITFMYNQLKSPNNQPETSKAIREFYFGDQSISNETKESLTNLYSDRFFIYPTVKTARLYARHGGPTYLYLFNHPGEHSNSLIEPGNPDKIVAHGDDILYLLHGPDFPENSPSTELRKKYIKLWTSFATEGKPTAVWGSVTNWPSLEEQKDEKLIWYKIDVDAALIQEPFHERINFWDSLPLSKLEEQV